MNKTQLVIAPRTRDLGGFSVRRILPYATHRMVGPFIFFDHIGPAVFPPGEGLDVRPHPHINLATVTYLFSGEIHHRDSLGSDQLIQPGAINWMTAGKGIVHSERTPDDLRRLGTSMNGIQCWVALPEEYEEIDPSFKHYPANALPEFKIDDVQFKLLLGTAFKFTSPVSVHSDLFYLDAKFKKGARLTLPVDGREAAVYVVEGLLHVDGQELRQLSMAVSQTNADIHIEALEDSHVMFIGGKSVGPRFIYWNFVSSSEQRIEKAKADWRRGPGAAGSPFQTIPGDDKEFIPLPLEPDKNPKGTIM